jgi:tRNA uridine 5-carboxymethylaminomethyl modification enzyme
MKTVKEFEIVVIGGGHAGIEASLVSSRLKNSVALVTLDKKKIGAMPCNPSIGGSAKGIVVREIDALGGEMGKAADATALQFKLLGTSGGMALQSLRVQSDKIRYSEYMQEIVNSQENLTIIEDSVEELIIEDKKMTGILLKGGDVIKAKAFILTTGTYLKPIVYKGLESRDEGPEGEKKIFNNISSQLKKAGLNFKRFKTGTSPRIITSTIDFSNLQLEKGSDLPLRFSHKSEIKKLINFSEQLPCFLIHTNKEVHEIIRKNFHLSPIFYKEDIGSGPRYCPSIEDKIYKFSDKERHQIFLEPESTELDTTYLQGLSTSLPENIQKEILEKLPGLKKSEVKKWGYAIEYDVIDSTQLNISLESKIIENLFFAGQINGTTGYEEAAAQGLIAGINANNKIKKKNPTIIGRDQGYIGVMIDDLTTKEINDPYRLLTSRAEYRLLLRHDNSETRLFSVAKKIGTLSEKG